LGKKWFAFSKMEGMALLEKIGNMKLEMENKKSFRHFARYYGS